MGALPKQNRLLDGIAPGSYFKRGSIRGKEDNGMVKKKPFNGNNKRADPNRTDRFPCSDCSRKEMGVVKAIQKTLMGLVLIILAAVLGGNYSSSSKLDAFAEKHQEMLTEISRIDAHQVDVMDDKVLSELAIKENTKKLSKIESAVVLLDQKAEIRNQKQDETNNLLRDVIKELK